MSATLEAHKITKGPERVLFFCLKSLTTLHFFDIVIVGGKMTKTIKILHLPCLKDLTEVEVEETILVEFPYKHLLPKLEAA